MRRSSIRSSRPSSWTGSSALSLERPDDERRHRQAAGRAPAVQAGAAASSPTCGTTISLARYQFSIAVSAPGARPVVEIGGLLLVGDAAEIGMAAEGLGVEGLAAHRRDALLHRRIAEGVDILRGGALGRVLDQALLEDERMRRVDDDEALDPVGMAQRRQPGDRAAPIVADQGEALRARARRRARSDPRRSGRSGSASTPSGLSEPAKPRWSGATTRKSRARAGATARQVRCDSGKPCRKRIASAPSGPPCWTLSVTPVGSGDCGSSASRLGHG